MQVGQQKKIPVRTKMIPRNMLPKTIMRLRQNYSKICRPCNMTPVWIAELVHINRSTGVREILDIINLWPNHTTKCDCYHVALAWMDKIWIQLLEQPVVTHH